MSETAVLAFFVILAVASAISNYWVYTKKQRNLDAREDALKNEQIDFDKYVKNWLRSHRTIQISNEIFKEIRNTDPEKIHNIILDYVTSKEFSKSDLRKLMKGYKMVQCINCMKEQLKNGCHE